MGVLMQKLDNEFLEVKNVKIDNRLWSQGKIHAIKAGVDFRIWLAKAMIDQMIQDEMKGGNGMPPTGKCTKCGQVYVGWGLVQREEENICLACGGPVIICPDQVMKPGVPVKNDGKK
jgi:hypothetical protein